MLSKRIARDWGESGPKESSAGSEKRAAQMGLSPSACFWHTGVSALFSQEEAPAPPARSGEGVLGRWEHPRLFLRNKREAGLGGGSPAHPLLRDQLRFPAGQPSSARCKSQGRCMIREVFQMQVAQRPTCVLLCENRMPSERVWDSRPGLGHVLQSAGPHLAESGAAARCGSAGSLARGQLRKAALSPRRRQQSRLMGCSTECSARRCLPDVLARAGPTKVKEAAPNRPAPHRGAFPVRLPHHELGGSTDSKANVQLLLLPSIIDPDSVGPRQLSCFGHIYIYSFSFPPIFGSEFSRLNLTESKLFSRKINHMLGGYVNFQIIWVTFGYFLPLPGINIAS